MIQPIKISKIEPSIYSSNYPKEVEYYVDPYTLIKE